MLEDTLIRLVAAIEGLTAALVAAPAPAPPPPPAPTPPVVTVDGLPLNLCATPGPVVTVAVPAAMDYDGVKDTVLEVIRQIGREPVVALLARYGAKTAKDIDPAMFQPFCEECFALLDA